jgi:DNA invertase Pin-like site-specific DNA recombinase
MDDKVGSTHLERLALVYLRQSSRRQVLRNRESTGRQYDLAQRPIALGWRKEMVEVVDGDLGRSATHGRRAGFEQVSERVARGEIGCIVALEVSRLARKSFEWHRLLELCGITDVLIVDERSVYSACAPEDRFHLGLKGVLSEAEQEWMKLRLRGACMRKAMRAELRMSVPVGYLWDSETSRLRYDEDEEVQRAIRLVFERFRVDGSSFGVVRYFVDHGLRVPGRSGQGELRWSPPRPDRVLDLLHNPAYAGVYVRGRRALTRKVIDGRIVSESNRVKPGCWQVMVKDRHPGYISWDDFMENQRRLQANRTSRSAPTTRGVARDGKALLQGIVLCGRCGHRMTTTYSGKNGSPRYVCRVPFQQGRSTHICWSVSAGPIDAAVSAQFLDAIQPAGIALGLAISREAERQASEVDKQWEARIARGEYDAHLAERRYKAVDPDNRTVARNLEREWEMTLRELEELRQAHRHSLDRRQLKLTREQRLRISALSRDVPCIWEANTTSSADRKRLLRTLVEQVCLAPQGRPAKRTEVKTLWKTGCVDIVVLEHQRLLCQQAPARADRLIRRLVSRCKRAPGIARQLNDAGLKTGSGNLWTNLRVHCYCRTHGIKWPHRMPTSVPVSNRGADGLHSVRGVAHVMRVSENAVRYWVARGWLRPVGQRGRGRAGWYKLTDRVIERLTRIKEKHTRKSGRGR